MEETVQLQQISKKYLANLVRMVLELKWPFISVKWLRLHIPALLSHPMLAVQNRHVSAADANHEKADS